MRKKSLNVSSKNFVQVGREMFDTPRYRSLPKDPAIHVVLHLSLFGPDTCLIPGLIRASREAFLSRAPMPMADAERALKWLEDHKYIIPSWDKGCAFAPDARHWRPILAGDRAHSGAISVLARFQSCPAKRMALRYMRSIGLSGTVSAPRQTDRVSDTPSGTRDTRQEKSKNKRSGGTPQLHVVKAPTSEIQNTPQPNQKGETSVDPTPKGAAYESTTPIADHVFTVPQLQRVFLTWLGCGLFLTGKQTQQAQALVRERPIALDTLQSVCDDVLAKCEAGGTKANPGLALEWIRKRREMGVSHDIMPLEYLLENAEDEARRRRARA